MAVLATLVLAAPAGFAVAAPPADPPAKSERDGAEPKRDLPPWARQVPPPHKDDGATPPDGSAPAAAPEKTGTPADAHKPPPDTPAQRRRALADLYAHLAAAGDAQSSAPVAAAIERLWVFSGSATIDVLMERVLKSVSEQRLDLAERLTDTIVRLEPGYAEGWNRRALVAYLRDDYVTALDALRRTLALDPNHFKALDGLANIMRDTGEKKAALEAYRRLGTIHPYWQGVDEAIEQLKREVEGQGI
ncbi:MAG: tetratricopeptide repeat protein [Hyphomicrobiaceae bacterium]